MQLQLPSATLNFSAHAKKGDDYPIHKLSSAVSGEDSPTCSTLTLCTQTEYSFPPSPDRETSLLGHSRLVALLSLVNP